MTRVGDFLGLEPTADPSRWSLPVSSGICGGRDAIYGGCALGAAIEVAEAATGRPLVWAACQFLGPSHLDSTIDLEMVVGAEGRAVTHGRVVASVDGRETFVALVSLGERPFEADHT